MVSHIKIVVKQLMGYTTVALKNVEAGALTDTTIKAMKGICNNVMGQIASCWRGATKLNE